MGRKTKPLTKFEIDNAKSKEKEYTLSDGHGLQLRVMPNGKTKSWRMLYSHPLTGKAHKITLGTYPTLSLANARKQCSNIRSLVAQGIDPKEFKKQKLFEHEMKHKHTLLNVAKEWIEVKKNDVSEDHAKDIWRALELHVFPQLATIPIADINAPDTIQALKPLAAKGSLEQVSRISQNLNQIVNYAINCGLRETNPLSGIKSAFKKPTVENMKSIEPDELPELMRALANANIKTTTRYLIEFQLHTMTRPSEAAAAKWDEIDFVNRTWTIPAERMKMKKEHRIPLTNELETLLDNMSMISGLRKHIFPADRNPNTHVNSQTANAALKRMGFKDRLVSHGLRALASTTLNASGLFDADVIEAALAHQVKGESRRPYNRTDYFERRAPMMRWWSNYIVEASKGYTSLSQCPSSTQPITNTAIETD
ncbi:tyrosine-type recombinase/integrase [Vibrio campbellii]|uniref:integrase domain-containing protein n=1 Tax=Vibrio sp. LB10LO1 TaxID=2711207 RepID=UPI00138971A2|nr:integrase domain-containing protein [Vibrio sp. LB10LO1]NDJ83048.1 tyrosine-type recombinase/integrase [Vibrio sp. LB10LO1]